MPTVSEANLRLALANVVHFGDTDVLPLPLERHWFAGDEAGAVSLLQSLDDDFDSYIANYPVVFVKSLTGVGYNGFRPVTQIDPVWNVYLLALVLEVAPDIEAARLPAASNVVFSYRYAPELGTGGLYAKDFGWRAFQTTALEQARASAYVLVTDISDFYPRIYHHRLENALKLATSNKEAAGRIIALLSQLADGVSYGLPIGGNAARLLAELLLNRVDRLLMAASIHFCRFVDDYAIFADSREEAQRALVSLSDFLLRNEGLTLGRAKSRLLTSAEYVRGSPLADPEASDSAEETETKRFLRIRWRYDPYSPTADEDYEGLVEEVRKFDVVSMLAREFRKTRIDESLVRQLVRSIRYLDPPIRAHAVISLADNLDTLYPVFPTVAIILRNLLPDLSVAVKDHVFSALRGLLRTGSHITMVPTNAAYTARLLAHDRNEQADALLSDLYQSPNANPMIRRDIICVMARRGAAYWLSDLLKKHAQLGSWERRALLAASYTLEDEGRHWRRQRDKELSGPDAAFARWLRQANNGKVWEIPV